jgi:hypothetical protein
MKLSDRNSDFGEFFWGLCIVCSDFARAAKAICPKSRNCVIQELGRDYVWFLFITVFLIEKI